MRFTLPQYGSRNRERNFVYGLIKLTRFRAGFALKIAE